MYCSFQPLQIDVKLNHYLCHFLGLKWANKPPKQVGYCFGDFVATLKTGVKLRCPHLQKVIKSESDLFSGSLPPLAVLPAWLAGKNR